MRASLPDDSRRWPDDPHELLGVAPDADDRTLRRAYTQLIRVYKPEQFPEQFRRIREAYESLLLRRQFLENLKREFPTAEIQGNGEFTFSPTPTPERKPRFIDEADQIWDWAINGETARAYSTLRELHERQPQRTDVVLRLYWLGTIFPDLDPERPAIQWLVYDLVNSGLSGPAAELYRQELRDNSVAAACAGACLVDAPASPERLAEVTTWRWQALLQHSRFDEFRDEFPIHRDRIRNNAEESWLGLVFACLEIVSWMAAQSFDISKALHQEVEQLKYHGVRLSAAFDRYEYLASLTTDWAGIWHNPRVPQKLAELLPQACYRSYDDLTESTQALLADINSAPKDWLKYLDFLDHHWPTGIEQLAGLFEYLELRQDFRPDPIDSVALANLLYSDFHRHLSNAYEVLRVKMLKFCLREMVGPEAIAPLLPNVKARGTFNCWIGQAFQADRPLRLVCWAHRLFWT